MIIEFFGFPGSGKTTITNQLIKQLKIDGYKVRRGTFDHMVKPQRVLYKSLYSLLCLFKNPQFFFYNLSYFYKHPRDNVKKLSFFLNATYLYSRYQTCRKKDIIVVFDQGLFQIYLSIITFLQQSKKYNKDNLLKYLDKVVLIELNFKENQRRLLGRKGNNIWQNPDMKLVEAAFEVYNEIKIQLEDDYPNNILKIQSIDSPENNINIIYEHIVKKK